MNVKKVVGILFLVAGCVLFGISLYIEGRLEQGQAQVAQSQEQLEKGVGGPPAVRPYVRRMEKKFTGSIEERIAAGEGQIAYYQQVANQCRWGGIASFAIGIVVLLFSRKKSKAKSR